MMLRQAQHEERFDLIFTLSLSKGEKRFAEGKRRAPRVRASGRDVGQE